MAILSIIFTENPGAENNAMESWNVMNIPVARGESIGDFFEPGVMFNIWKLLYNKEALKDG